MACSARRCSVEMGRTHTQLASENESRADGASELWHGATHGGGGTPRVSTTPWRTWVASASEEATATWASGAGRSRFNDMLSIKVDVRSRGKDLLGTGPGGKAWKHPSLRASGAALDDRRLDADCPCDQFGDRTQWIRECRMLNPTRRHWARRCTALAAVPREPRREIDEGLGVSMVPYRKRVSSGEANIEDIEKTQRRLDVTKMAWVAMDRGALHEAAAAIRTRTLRTRLRRRPRRREPSSRPRKRRRPRSWSLSSSAIPRPARRGSRGNATGEDMPFGCEVRFPPAGRLWIKRVHCMCTFAESRWGRVKWRGLPISRRVVFHPSHGVRACATTWHVVVWRGEA